MSLSLSSAPPRRLELPFFLFFTRRSSCCRLDWVLGPSPHRSFCSCVSPSLCLCHKLCGQNFYARLGSPGSLETQVPCAPPSLSLCLSVSLSLSLSCSLSLSLSLLPLCLSLSFSLSRAPPSPTPRPGRRTNEVYGQSAFGGQGRQNPSKLLRTGLGPRSFLPSHLSLPPSSCHVAEKPDLGPEVWRGRPPRH